MTEQNGDYGKISCFRYLGVENCQKAFAEGLGCRDWTQFDFAPLIWYYRTNGTFKRIIDIIPDNALKNGITINGENQMIIEKMLNDFDYKKYFATALKQSRLFGRSLMVLSIDDGQYLKDENGALKLGPSGRPIIDVSKEVMYNKIKSVKIGFIYGASDFTILYENQEDEQKTPNRQTAGSVTLNWDYYMLQRVRDNRQLHNDSKDKTLQDIKVHRTRALLFVNDDIYTDAKGIVNYATSEFFRVFQPLSRLNIVEESAAADAANSQVGVLTVRLQEMLDNTKNKDEEGAVLNAMQTRTQLFDIAKQLKQTILLNEGEEYKNVPASLNGFGDIIEKLRKGVSAASDIPMSILFGEKQSGLSNDGSKDLEVFYNIVKAKQETALRSQLLYLIKLFDCVVRNNNYVVKKTGSGKGNYIITRQKKGVLETIKNFFQKTSTENSKKAKEDEEEEEFYNTFRRITFEFNELWQLSSLDKAKIRKMEMEAFVSATNSPNPLLTVEEVRNQSEFNQYFEYNDNNTRNKIPKATNAPTNSLQSGQKEE